MAVQKTILKRYSGTAWDEIYLKGVADIVEIGKAITLATPVAGYETTATIAATDSVQAVIEKLAYPLVQLDKVTVPAIQSDIADLEAGTSITSIDASKISGVLSLANIPQGALERVVTVANDEARKALTTENIQTGDVCKVTDTGKMYFVVADTDLAQDSSWMEFTAGQATSVPWSGVTGTPTTVDGYGITDAITDADTATTGANKVLMTNSDGAIEVNTTGNAATASSVEWTGVQNKPTTVATSGLTDAVADSDCATTGNNVVLMTNAEGKIIVDTTGNAATATNVAFTGITGLDASVTAEALKTAVEQTHTHSNKTVLDALADSTGTLTYNGAAIATQEWVEQNYSSTIALVSKDPVEGMATGDLCLVTISA